MSEPAVLSFEDLPGAGFGRLATVAGGIRAEHVVDALESDPRELLDAFHGSHGLVVLRGLGSLEQRPELLLRLSRLFGAEVEDYTLTAAARNLIHPDVPQILLVSNVPPATRTPPARPDPPFTADGRLPTRFPHRRGWHTDQSYRRPPPDVSLFYALEPIAPGQGDTLYASGVLAWRALPDALRARVEGLVGLHCSPGKGRAEYAVRAGEVPLPLAANEQPQRQPVVRVHPVTGDPALFLCEAGQMDWVEGPFEGMEPGVDGDGAKLLYELMSHYTRDEFVYVHRWKPHDITIYDNRSLIHAATWFDAQARRRVMWRTTVWGNPGKEYAGEARSWLVPA